MASTLQDEVRRVLDRLNPTDLGAIVVIVDKDGFPTTHPLRLNWPGRFEALGLTIATLAKEVPAAVAKTMRSASTQIRNAAKKLPPLA